MVQETLKVFRDPIYELISFNKEYDKPIIDIIDSPEFQRLRRIKQLGFSSYTFPGSVHDRFSHSLGVAFIVGEMFDALNVTEPIDIKEIDDDGRIQNIHIGNQQLKLLLQLTGILHDIGHGPFSHAFEKISKTNHETLSKRIITSEDLSISRILKSQKDDLLRKYSIKWIIEILSGTFKPTWVKELISSQIDADRIDYLLRDAYMCGVKYATFDWRWLFLHMEIDEIPAEERIGIVINGSKGIHALESFIISRYHMYEQVYFHKTTRCMETLVGKIFSRLDTLREEGKLDQIGFIDTSLPSFIKDNNNLNAFLKLDDSYLFTQFNSWRDNCEDEILRELSVSVIDRKVFKMCGEEKDEELFTDKQILEINKLLGAEFDYYFFKDSYLNSPYKDNYLLGRKSPQSAEHIWLKTVKGTVEFSQCSPIIKSLQNEDVKKRRAYIHRKYLSAIMDIKKQKS